MGEFAFLDHVNRKTERLCMGIESLGYTIDMLMHMSHRDSSELRATAKRLRRIIKALEAKAKEIDKAREANHG